MRQFERDLTMRLLLSTIFNFYFKNLTILKGCVFEVNSDIYDF